MFYIANFKLQKKFFKQKKFFIKIKKALNLAYYKLINSKNNSKQNVSIIKIFKILNIFFYKKFFFKLKKIKKLLTILKKWARIDYRFIISVITFNLYNIQKLLLKFVYFFKKFIYNFSLINLNSNKLKQKEFFSENNLNLFYEEKFNDILKKNLINNLRIQNVFYKGLKKVLYSKPKTIRYKKYFYFILKNLRQRRLKKRKFKT
jgi:hypothetical protein